MTTPNQPELIPAIVLPLPTRARVAPLVGSAGISVLLHAGLLLLFSVATWAITTATENANPEYGAQLVAEETPPIGLTGSFRFPGNAGVDVPDSARAGPSLTTGDALGEILKSESKESIRPSVASGSESLAELSRGELSRSDIVGVGIGGGQGSSSGGAGSGLGDRDVAGGGPVGSMWGVGQGQNARSVVYVMDRSGSMTDTFTLLQRELMRAVGSLNQDQLFNVLWFNEGKATELFPRLKAATLDNKREAFDAIKSIVPSGQTQPVDAVKRALAYQPDVMFLLSDGDFGEDNKRIMTMIKQSNPGKRTRLNTILFVYDTIGSGERVLREIAESNGGSYKHVTEDDARR
ncbi:MAG: hypothetical protein AABZ08_13320 [Planctomycetota bacterium]|mgnify:FL=1